MISGMFGAHHMPNRVWAPQVEYSGEGAITAPPEELAVDPTLPVLAVDPLDPAAGIVIPRGRFVAIGFAAAVGGGGGYRMTINDNGKTVLTLCDGQNLTPVGISVNQMYKESKEYMLDSNTVKFRRNVMVEVPFVSAVNDAHGTLRSGDAVAAYWGSTTTASPTAVAFHHRGKPVKWQAMRLYFAPGTGSSNQALTAAIYPGIRPASVIGLSSTGTGVALSSLQFDGTQWVADFAAAVTQIFYLYGQDADQIAGELVRVQSVQDILDRDDWLKWVEMAPQDWLEWPPAAQRAPVTAVTNETPATIVAGFKYRVANYPISIHHPVIVQIQGVVTDTSGNQTTYSGSDWFTLPTGVLQSGIQSFVGLYHSVNWRTGIIEISGNISVTNIRVSYSYITNPATGSVLWGGGLVGLTDGSLAGTQPGLPPHLNLSDVAGALRIIVT